jgi:hypothetical protein
MGKSAFRIDGVSTFSNVVFLDGDKPLFNCDYSDTFYNVPSLTRLDIGARVMNLGREFGVECPSLKTIIIRNDRYVYEAHAVSGDCFTNYTGVTVYVPDALLNSYKSA